VLGYVYRYVMANPDAPPPFILTITLVENFGFSSKVPRFPERIHNLPWAHDGYNHDRVSTPIF
jgi:hypothetical protein